MDFSPKRNQHQEIASYQYSANLEHTKKNSNILPRAKTHFSCSPLIHFDSIKIKVICPTTFVNERPSPMTLMPW